MIAVAFLQNMWVQPDTVSRLKVVALEYAGLVNSSAALD